MPAAAFVDLSDMMHWMVTKPKGTCRSTPTSQVGKFLKTPQQHRETAARLREKGNGRARAMAVEHENLATAIERRLQES